MNLKKLYITFSGILGVAGLILAFENIMIQGNGMMIFFDTVTGSLFWPLILVFFIGFGSGFFAGLALKTSDKKEAGDYGSDIDI